MEDSNYYDYTEERNEEFNFADVDKSDQYSESVSNSTMCENDSDDKESNTNYGFISYHKRVCEKSLVDIKNSLPLYNKWLPKKNFGK